MSKSIWLLIVFAFVLNGGAIYAQTDINDTDTIPVTSLQEVVVKAFDQNRKLKDIPAAVNIVSPAALERFGAASIVSAVNTTPGVHMEERSPGSYRFNIRGSSLRSPFGVRNVKVYFNNIPITDPGGNTYLNQLGYYNLNSIEIIKGPGSSLYGAGTGGVLLIQSNSGREAKGLTAAYTAGSYGLHNIYAAITTGNESNKNTIGIQHQQSNGYRQQSQLRRDVVSWTGNYTFTDRQQLTTTFLYGDLYYQTPGALTLAEYTADAKQSRPAVGGFPSAVQSKAAIYQKTVIAGASLTQHFSGRLQNTSTAYGAFTELKNPTIRNYGKNLEPHFGGRTDFQYTLPLTSGQWRINAGGEGQQSFNTVNVYKNKNGNADSLQTNDDVHTRQSFAFVQTSLELHSWTIMAGASINQMTVAFQRFYPAPSPKQKRIFNNELAPRLAILKKIDNLSLYSSISKGFSPPATAELTPSGSAVNLGLNAEHGINYDIGVRGTILKRLYIDVNAFWFSLHNTIVQRRDIGGGDYFINAGATSQKGIETYISHPLFTSSPYIKRGLFWLSHTWHHFHYKSFKQLDNDYSGNQLPGEPPHTISTGLDILARNGLSGNINYYYSDKIALNDANTAYANAYHLLGAKVGYEKTIKQKYTIQLFAGADNILNQQYSLGNDINGFGGRYYNAAVGRNYYVGVKAPL